MANLTWIQSTKLPNGRIVRPGDTVDLVEKPSHGREFMLRFLKDPAPWLISNIGQWPCGRIMLYFKTSRGGPGAYAKDFK